MKRFIQINPADDVAVMLDDSNPAVPCGHKFALRDIAAGENVVKYGMPIGRATVPIRRGEHVHIHNLKTNLDGLLEYRYEPSAAAAGAPAAEEQGLTFQGYRRADGGAGIRNHIFVVPTVGCVNRLARALAQRLNRELGPGCAVKALALEHPYGCSQLGADHEMTRAVLAGLVHHPNAGGVLVVGLGCENNTVDSFRSRLGAFDRSRIRFLVAQEAADEMEEGMELLRSLARTALAEKRTAIPLCELVIGLKCGGSDGLSGVTANPLVGRFADWLGKNGGSAVLGEVPEMFGAETLLMARCRNHAVFAQCVEMINGFKGYFQRYGQVVYENPSPGNKAGGITTLEDKSLGCVQKAGTGAVNGVLRAGEHVRERGLNLLSGPGNDMVASTLLAASGAHLILFTTGRGTPFGTVVPTLKIASNRSLAEHKRGWIDFDASRVLREEEEAVEADFRRKILAVVNGEEAANERNEYEEIAIFKDGVTL